MTPRIDAASRTIAAQPYAVYRAFAEPGAMERWLPPNDMTAEARPGSIDRAGTRGPFGPYLQPDG